MKKIFTLIATALVAMGASAQTLIDFPTSKAGTAISGSTTEGTFQEIACYTLKNGYSSDGAYNENSINLTVDGGFKAGDVVTIAGGIKNADESKRGTVVIFTLDGTSTTALKKFEDFPNFQNEGAAFTNQSYTLEADADKLYLGRDGNTGTNVTLIQVTRAGGGSGDKVTYSPIVLNEGGSPALAPEFAAIVDGDIATNVVDGRSIVEISRGCVTLTAVGGTTPANVSGGGGAQQITPGAKIEGEDNKYEVASVEAWNNIEWKNGNNKTDIETPMYFLMGTGNPYVKLLCEEIITEGTPTGTYRADYVYYEPDGSKGLPITGLYYKFKSTEAGAFKVNVWGNKGNRKTYVVNSKDAKATKLYAEGYLEGQTGYLTTTQIDALHAEGADPAIIGTGTKFWGYLIFDIQAGDEVWVFQHSSQIGFGGYEFYPGSKASDIITPDGGDTGIIITKTVKNDADAPMYNLSGQKVDKSYKGIVIQNGRKFVNK